MKTHSARAKLDPVIRLIHRALPKNRWGDRISSMMTFWKSHGRLPRSQGGDLNDELFRLKTSDEILDPTRVFVSDKHQLKLYVKALAGDKYNVPTHAVLRSIDEAKGYEYPADCVIKPTHMSGEVVFRRNGSPVDFGRMAQWFESNYYNRFREANYKTLKPKVIVEPFIFGGEHCEDYKIYCVGGEPKMILVDQDRHDDHRRNIYAADWSLLPITIKRKQGADMPRPDNLDEMLDLARTLSRDFSLIRVDLYSNGEEIMVGELTNCPGDARDRVTPIEKTPLVTDLLFGQTSLL